MRCGGGVAGRCRREGWIWRDEVVGGVVEGKEVDGGGMEGRGFEGGESVEEKVGKEGGKGKKRGGRRREPGGEEAVGDEG